MNVVIHAGWVANAQKMNGGATAPPFVAPGMTR